MNPKRSKIRMFSRFAGIRTNNMSEALELSEQAKAFKPGLYRHFKGGEYEALMIGRSSEARDQEFVVYKSLEKGTVWIRPLSMFLEHVERDGYSGPRFMYLGNMADKEGIDLID